MKTLLFFSFLIFDVHFIHLTKERKTENGKMERIPTSYFPPSHNLSFLFIFLSYFSVLLFLSCILYVHTVNVTAMAHRQPKHRQNPKGTQAKRLTKMTTIPAMMMMTLKECNAYCVKI